MKLKRLLKQSPPDKLVAVANSWGIVIPDESDAADYLATRMQGGAAFPSVYEHLDQLGRDTLLFLAVHGGLMSEAELVLRAFDGDQAAAGECMSELAATGMAFELTDEETGDLLYAMPEPVLKWIDVPAHLQGFCGRLLGALAPQALAEIAANIPGLEKSGKDPLLAYRIRSVLLDPERLRAHIAALPDNEREMFEGIMRRKGHCLYRELLDPANTKRFDHVKAEQLNAMIAARGLIFSVMEGQNKYTNLLMVPRDVFQTVSSGYLPDQRPLRDLDVLAFSSSEFVPEFILDNSNMLLREIALFAAYVDSHNLKRVASGGIGKNDLKKAVSVVSSSKDSKYIAFLAAFLITNKYLMNVRGVWKVSDSFREWLVDGARCYWDVYNWWMATTTWDEASPDRVVPPTGQQAGRSLAFHLRRPLLEAVATVPPGKWISFTAFAETLVPQIETTFSDSIGRGGSGSLQRALLAVLTNMMREPISWLGLVSLGLREPFQSDEGPVGSRAPRAKQKHAATDFFFHRTPLGNHVLSRLGRESDAANVLDVHEFPPMLRHEGDQFIVQPNLAVIAPPDLSLDRLLLLARFSDVRNVDVVTSFEITRDSLGKGMNRGLGGDEILTFLHECSRMELPPMINHFIQDCSSKHGEAAIGLAGGYIMVDAPLMLQEIRSNPRIAPYVKDVIADKVILLAPDCDLQKIARELRQFGVMPQLESETVHATTDDKFHVTLSSEELCDVIAGMRLVGALEEELKIDITRGKAIELAQKLKPETPGFLSLHRYLDTTSKSFVERFKGALARVIDEVSDRYKTQVSRLVTRSVRTRTPSKYSFKGPNPAVERKDIIELLSFAREYELETEITYVRQNEQEARVLITPKSFEGERLYAYCVATDSDSMYSLQRILRAKLV
jgi:hypothetical protein